MKLKRNLCLLLVFCFLLPSLAACSESTPNAENETQPTNVTGGDVDTTGNEEDPADVRLYPDLPDVNYGDATFTIYISTNEEYGEIRDDFSAEEYNAEPINDAKYDRNTAIEDKYGIKLNVEKATGIYYTEGTNTVRTSVQSGDNAYDFVMLAGYSTSALANQGILYDLYEVPYLNLKNPWWDQRANEDLTIMNRMYYTTGDISTADNAATYCIMFNKELITEYHLDNPYDMVNNGTWTIDNYASMVKQVSGDLNGDGQRTAADLYGAIIWDDSIMGVINATGEKCASVDETGKIVLTLYSDKVVSVLEKYFDFALNKELTFEYQRNGVADTQLMEMFQNNQGLFIQQLLQLVPKLRDMEADFGILPYYKYDEAQETYYNTVGSWHSVFMAVPAGRPTNLIERAGIIAEALAAESKYTVTPAYYDVTLKGKSSRDEESAAMLDIIFETRIYDLGWYYQFGGYNEAVMNLFRQYQTDFTSMYRKNQKVAQKVIDKLNSEFAELTD